MTAGVAAPGWAQVASVDWRHAPDDWDHVALASYAEQLPEYHASRSAGVRAAVRAFLERHRAALAADHPRSRLFREGGRRGRARRRRVGAASRRELERRRRDAGAQRRDEFGRFRAVES